MDSNMDCYHSLEKVNMDGDLKQRKFVSMIVWEHLYMAGEHLDIIRINNKNPENQRFCSLANMWIKSTATLPKLW